MRSMVCKILPFWLRALVRHLRSRVLLTPNAHVSFSQEGEDLLLARLFEPRTHGFYVDVGAHHPTRFSNTHLLYIKGWRGINIDAVPGSMDAFRRARRRDINLEIAVSSDGRPQRLYLFDEPALNSLSKELSMQRSNTTGYSIKKEIILPTRSLHEILAEYLPADMGRIDLMTVDVEGRDLDVLRSNDWSRFRPCILLIEVVDASLEDLNDREEVVYLRGQGYQLYAKLVHTVVLIDGNLPRPRSSDGY